MVDQDSIERLGQERDAHLVCEVFVDFVAQEVLLFSYECIANFHTIDDILLNSLPLLLENRLMVCIF